MITDRIKALCAERGIKIKSLEKELNFGNGTIGKWDTSAPSIERAIIVAEYFGVSVDYLCGRTEIKETANDGGLPDDVAEVIKAFRSDPRLRAFVLQQIQTYKTLLAAPAADSK